MNLDIKLFYFINHLPHNKFLDRLALIIHRLTYGAVIYWPIIAYTILKGGTTRRFGLELFFGIALNFVANEVIIKYLVRRQRPYLALASVHYIPPAPKYPFNQSFASGQSANAFLFAVLIIITFANPLWSAAALIFAATVALSRVYMGHHYPTDALAGVIIGSIIGWLLVRFV